MMELGVFISNFHESLVECGSQVVPLPWNFQPANQKVEPSCQTKALGTEEQNASISERVLAVTRMVKQRGKCGAEIVQLLFSSKRNQDFRIAYSRF